MLENEFDPAQNHSNRGGIMVSRGIVTGFGEGTSRSEVRDSRRNAGSNGTVPVCDDCRLSRLELFIRMQHLEKMMELAVPGKDVMMGQSAEMELQLQREKLDKKEMQLCRWEQSLKERDGKYWVDMVVRINLKR